MISREWGVSTSLLLMKMWIWENIYNHPLTFMLAWVRKYDMIQLVWRLYCVPMSVLLLFLTGWLSKANHLQCVLDASFIPQAQLKSLCSLQDYDLFDWVVLHYWGRRFYARSWWVKKSKKGPEQKLLAVKELHAYSHHRRNDMRADEVEMERDKNSSHKLLVELQDSRWAVVSGNRSV